MKALTNYKSFFFIVGFFEISAVYSESQLGGMTQKIVPKNILTVGYEMYTRENEPMTKKKSWNRNSDVAYGTIFRVSSCYHRGKQKL
jgi:hypothetical protein